MGTAGKSASLKKGPLDVPPRMSRQGIAVCALFFMVQVLSPEVDKVLHIFKPLERTTKTHWALSDRTNMHNLRSVMAKYSHGP
jgi:hypothetical protein